MRESEDRWTWNTHLGCWEVDPSRIYVAVSGFFNPLHEGHLKLFFAAKKLGTHLVVIVNNDKQVALKGSCPLLNEKTRLEIISNLRLVDGVVLSIDTDATVCKTLKEIRPHIFANGGDRNGNDGQSTAEEKVCAEIECDIVYGVGGNLKQASSSDLIKNAVNWYNRQQMARANK
jgi:cytidyltransferase-like protein